MKKIPNCYLTVGDIGRITGHGRATVLRWVNRGDLEPAYYLPSESAHIRIELSELRRFLKVYEMPTPEKFLSMYSIKVTVSKKIIEVSESKVKTKTKKKKIK